MNISIIQTTLHWEDRDANLRMLGEKILGITDVDLVVLPEMFATGFSMDTSIAEDANDGPSVKWLIENAKQKKTTFCGSLMVKDGDHFFNRAYFVFPDGKIQTYNKRHLFSLGKEEQHYRPGNTRLVVEYKGWKIAPLICYDLRFPVWARRTEDFNYDILIYTANWPERRGHAWRTLLPARAIENQAYVVGANRVGNDAFGILHSGDSAVIDPMGKYIKQGTSFTEEIVTAELSRSYLEQVRKNLPFFDDGDVFDLK